jgi:hypothetical protein
MMRRLILLVATLLVAGCSPPTKEKTVENVLAGTWRASLQFESGPLAAVKDLEFMYVFNAGGTMTESSNYDANPPVPPAYGIWRKTGERQFEAKYEFYNSRPGTAAEGIAPGGGWLPAGRGVLRETITLANDGNSFTSTIRYESFDLAGKPTAGGGTAAGKGIRLRFD